MKLEEKNKRKTQLKRRNLIFSFASPVYNVITFYSSLSFHKVAIYIIRHFINEIINIELEDSAS